MDIKIQTPGRAGKQQEMTTMKVWAKNEQMHNFLSHPIAGPMKALPFPEPAEWPNDTFTFRRMRDGDILDHDPHAEQQRSAENVERRPTTAKAKE